MGFFLCFYYVLIVSNSFSSKWQMLRRKFGNACSSGLFVEMALELKFQSAEEYVESYFSYWLLLLEIFHQF